MNTFVLMTALMGSFVTDDFHYIKDNQVTALPLTNKLYFETNQNNANDLYGILNPRDLTRKFKGLILTFEDNDKAFKALNKILQFDMYRNQVCPIVKYGSTESIVSNYLVVELQPTVKKQDYLTRLKSVCDAKFEYIDSLSKKSFKVIEVKNIKNPANILALADLVARDTFWVKSAVPRLIPLEDITVSLSVETPSQTDLGHIRVVKLVINVYDPKILVRTDLLPVIGQGNFKPFPYAGDTWLDLEPHTITKTDNAIIVEYPFKYLQFGAFVFEPIKISYEQDGVLSEVSSKPVTFYVGSVTQDMDIENIQPVLNDSKISTKSDLELPIKPDNQNLLIIFGLTGIAGIAFICLSIFPLLVSNKIPKEVSVWDKMKNCLNSDDSWEEYYANVNNSVDNVLVEEFGVSLHSLKPEVCNDNFKSLLSEFDNLYIPNEQHNLSNLKTCVLKFYKDRRYD